MSRLEDLHADWRRAQQHAWDLQAEKDAVMADYRVRLIRARQDLLAAERALNRVQVAQYHADHGSHPNAEGYEQGVLDEYHALLEGRAA